MSQKLTEFKTFNEWSNTGYRILKGSKSIVRNSEGIPLFHKTQVTRKIKSYGNHWQETDGEWDDWGMGMYGELGNPWGD